MRADAVCNTFPNLPLSFFVHCGVPALQRPYGSMKQQQLVEEVVMRGLRPRFSSSTPPPYVSLAQACWSGSAAARPQFDDALGQLHMMLQVRARVCVQCARAHPVRACVSAAWIPGRVCSRL